MDNGDLFTIYYTNQEIMDENIENLVYTKKGEHKKVMIEHIRGKKKELIATIVAVVRGDELLFGCARYNKKLETVSPSKKIGVRHAISRALANRREILLHNDSVRMRNSNTDVEYPLPQVIRKRIAPFINKATTYFKRPFSNVVGYLEPIF